ncbi:MAG: hypothetical protein KDA65_05920 [Planctomycetaceae bacterium]|nr:hypothetical protein [Planctomycetaceae bacterium]
MILLWLLHFSMTLFMTGVIWFVQLVHYPLFSEVGPHEFRDYTRLNQMRTSVVVIPAMLCELVTGVLLLSLPATLVPRSFLVVNMVLLVLIWLSTFLLQVPCHSQLLSGYSPKVVGRLVMTNWLRTAGWTARAVLLFVCMIEWGQG